MKAYVQLLCASLALSAVGQTPSAIPTPGLEKERSSFLRQILTESQAVTEQYEKALARLEGELATAAEYEEARLVQKRRNELKTLYFTAQTSAAQSSAIPLPLAVARLSGSTEVRGDGLTGWRTTGSSVEWTNLRVSPGRYHLELDANMVEGPASLGNMTGGRTQPQERASFDFYEVSLLAGAQENRRTFDITNSDSESAFSPVRVGPVNFSRSPVTLRLVANGGYPGNVVHLRNLRLVPVTAEPIPSAPPMPESALSLSAVRQRLATDLAAAQHPAFTEYLAGLQAAAADPIRRQGSEAEMRRLNQMLARTRSDGAMFLRSLLGRETVAGFENLEDAIFVADPLNSGDRFMVEHENKRLVVKLLWTEASPMDGQDGKAPSRKAFAQHFGITEDEAAGLARLAQEFTAGYLDGKPLRLLVRPGRDKDGSVRALVFVPEVGLFQNVLVDQGLAKVEPPAGVQLPAAERALLGLLQEREEIAARQKTGGWSMREERKP